MFTHPAEHRLQGLVKESRHAFCAHVFGGPDAHPSHHIVSYSFCVYHVPYLVCVCLSLILNNLFRLEFFPIQPKRRVRDVSLVRLRRSRVWNGA